MPHIHLRSKIDFDAVVGFSFLKCKGACVHWRVYHSKPYIPQVPDFGAANPCQSLLLMPKSCVGAILPLKIAWKTHQKYSDNTRDSCALLML
jgi:hypothetical protein